LAHHAAAPWPGSTELSAYAGEPSRPLLSLAYLAHQVRLRLMQRMRTFFPSGMACGSGSPLSRAAAPSSPLAIPYRCSLAHLASASDSRSCRDGVGGGGWTGDLVGDEFPPPVTSPECVCDWWGIGSHCQLRGARDGYIFGCT
jgi:hypothetical protein